MASFHVWLEVLSYVKALVEATTLGVDFKQAYDRHRQERETIAEAERVSQTFSTYSEEEVESLLRRLKDAETVLSRKAGVRIGQDVFAAYSMKRWKGTGESFLA